MKLAKAISRRIRELREAAGLSQQDVAMRADLSMSLVAKLEQGKKADPRASTLLAPAHALAVPPGKLLDDLAVTVTETGADSETEPPAKKGKKKKKKARADKPAPADGAPAVEAGSLMVTPGIPTAEAPLPGGKKKKKNKAKTKPQ